MQQLGLWKYLKSAYTEDPDVYSKIKEDHEVRPQYYAYSLLTRFVRQGDEVYPLDLGDELIAGSFSQHRGKMAVCTFQRYRQRQDDTVGK